MGHVTMTKWSFQLWLNFFDEMGSLHEGTWSMGQVTGSSPHCVCRFMFPQRTHCFLKIINKCLRSMTSFLLFSNQVYRAALLLVFMGVPLLRCCDRWLWFKPVHSTTSRCGMLCCCMYILINLAACHGSILYKKIKAWNNKIWDSSWLHKRD